MIFPILTGQPAKESHLSLWKSRMEIALDDVENIWLKSNQYLAGDKISVADLVGLCEIDQPCEYQKQIVGNKKLKALL